MLGRSLGEGKNCHVREAAQPPAKSGCKMLKSLLSFRGRITVSDRVLDLRERKSDLILPSCTVCGFGHMRIVLWSGDPEEPKPAPGMTRLRCDRADCGHQVTIESETLVAA